MKNNSQKNSKNALSKPALFACNFSLIGSNLHAQKKECQDRSLARGLEGTKRKVDIIVACDGHGSTRHDQSRFGATFACQVIQEIAQNLCDKNLAINYIFNYLTSSQFIHDILHSWKQKCFAHAGTQDAEALVRYGTTLLFALATHDILVCGQIGDGAVALYSQKEPRANKLLVDVPKTSQQTASLCMQDAHAHFTVQAFDIDRFDTVLLATDGVYDTFTSSQDFLSFVASCDNFATQGQEQAQLFIGEAMQQIQQNTCDDMSIAMLKLCASAPSKNGLILDSRLSDIYGNSAFIALKQGKLVLYMDGEPSIQHPNILHNDSYIAFSEDTELCIYDTIVQGTPILQSKLSIEVCHTFCQNLCHLIHEAEQQGIYYNKVNPHKIFTNASGQAFVFADSSFSGKNKPQEQHPDYACPKSFKGNTALYATYKLLCKVYEQCANICVSCPPNDLLMLPQMLYNCAKEASL